MASPVFLFAPGAGASSSHPWMQHWAGLLGTLGVVQAFDYPYIKKGGKRPDPLPKLIAAHREALADARRLYRGPIVLIGKSMGSRVGCHLSLEEKVKAVVCLGYPLCGGGDPTRLRDQVLREMSAPILFVQGTRDALCPPELLERVRGEMTARHDVHGVTGGDHSLLVGKRHLNASGLTQDTVDQESLQVIRGFVASCLR